MYNESFVFSFWKTKHSNKKRISVSSIIKQAEVLNMAQQTEQTSQAESAQDQNQNQNTQAGSSTPSWDNMGKDQVQLPFLDLNEDKKRKGFRVKFLAEGPRKETVNDFNPKNPVPELWFDVETEGEAKTWTIYQITLLSELKKHAPLKDKTFDIKLEPVTKEFKEQNPKYKGRDKYVVTEVKEGDVPAKKPEQTEQAVEDII